MSAAMLLAGADSPEGPVALYPWSGRHLLEAVLDELASWPATRIVVVIGAEAETVLARCRLSQEVVVDYDWRDGPGSQLRAGLDHLGRERDPGPAIVADVQQPRTPSTVAATLLGQHESGITVPLYKYEIGFPLVIDRARWEWFMGRVVAPLDLLAAHPEWVTPIRFDSPRPARVRSRADAAVLAP